MVTKEKGTPARPYKMNNSRYYPRLKVAYLMKYMVVDESGDETVKTANTKDMSAGGLRFCTAEAPAEGSLVRVSVLLPPYERSVTAFGRVLKVRQAAGDVRCVSVAFIEISKEDQQLITSFIERLSKSPEARSFIDLKPRAVRNPAAARSGR